MKRVVLLLSLSAAGTAAADPCRRPVVAYHAPAYSHPSYHAKEFVPFAVTVEVYKDRHFALSDLYRDKLYLDLYERLQQLNAGPAAPQPKAAAGGVKAVLAESCVRCHKAGSEVDLSNADAVPEAVRWKAYGLTAAGEMPQGGKPVSDEALRALYQWARQR